MLYRGKRYVALAAFDRDNVDAAWDAFRYDPLVGADSTRDEWLERAEDDEDEAFNDFAGEYWDSLERYESLRSGVACFRALRLPADVDPAVLERLGTDWSLRRAGADTYRFGKGDVTVVYRAKVDTGQLDPMQTVIRYIAFGAEEDEVTWRENVPVYVYDVELEDGSVVPINDWRRT